MEKMKKSVAWILAVACLLSCTYTGHNRTSEERDDIDTTLVKGEVQADDGSNALVNEEVQARDVSMTEIEDKDSLEAKDFLRNLVLSFETKPDIELMYNSLTLHAYEMYFRMVMEHDCDMLILAQDIPDDFEKTLKVKRIKRGWYRMEYYDTYSGKRVSNCFYLTREKHDGRLRVAYVHGFGSEEIDETTDADSLFWKTKPKIKVGGDTSLEFIRSFYQAYVAEYLSLDAEVKNGTSALREKYLSDDAKAQYAMAASEYDEDVMHGYDVLIGGVYTTMRKECARKIKEIRSGVFSVDNRIEISVERINGRWLIMGIKIPSTI